MHCCSARCSSYGPSPPRRSNGPSISAISASISGSAIRVLPGADFASWAAAALLALGVDGPRHVVARGELGRAPRIGLPALHRRLHPAARFGLVTGVFVTARLGQVTPHEALALLVAQDAAFAAHALGDEQP